MSLKDKVIVITGASRGIGHAIAVRAAQDGAKVAILAKTADANPKLPGTIHTAADDVKTAGGQALAIQCDIRFEDQVAAAITKVVTDFGGIDILVNIAGGSGPVGKSGVETTPEEFEEIVRLNVNGCFHTMRAVLPTMIKQRYGKVVNVGGTFGMRGKAGRISYSASKWGLRGVTKSFALEVGMHNINVNYVAPGMVDGPRFRDKVCADMAKRLGITPEEAAERHAQDYALKRITIDDDVANACLFMASDVSRQITGADLPVDGGWAML